MARGTIVTQGTIEEIKKLKANHPDLTNEMLAKLSDTSSATVGRVLNGYYDEVRAVRTTREEESGRMLLDELKKTNSMLTCVLLVLANMVDPIASHSKELANRARKLARENMEVANGNQ